MTPPEPPAVFTVAREHGETPEGNPIGGRWVVRRNGAYFDVDQYRHDLLARHEGVLTIEMFVDKAVPATPATQDRPTC